jgi:transposase
METVIRYSEAFKLQVIREMEEGKHGSCGAAREAYGIGGADTVQRWVRQYGKTHLTRKVMRVETTEERNELRKLKARVRELERALVDAHLDLRLGKAWLELACEAGGIDDVEAFKKNILGCRPQVSRQRQRREERFGIGAVWSGRHEPPELLRDAAPPTAAGRG